MKKSLIWVTAILIIVAGSLYVKKQIGPGHSESPKGTADQAGTPNKETGTKPPEAPSRQNSFAVRGVIEGFYGTPWSLSQRTAMFDFMRQSHFNTYVFAPKDDPYQRRQWMDLYPEDKLEEMKTLVKAAESNGIRFVYSISPGLPIPLENQPVTQDMVNDSITYSSSLDQERLEKKMDQLYSLGIHTFMLSFDDVQRKLKEEDQKVYGHDYAKAQMVLANQLLDVEKKHSDFELWFAPTIYYGLKDGPYWQTLRTHLDPQVQVIWTGSWVLSGAITTSQADLITKWLGRKPLIWDNYPVNDYTYAVNHKPQLLLGPIQNRSSDLGDHVTGLLSNPMIQPESSKIALYTIGQYLHDSLSYQPDKAWDEAIRQIKGISDYDGFRRFCSYSRESFLVKSGNPAFTALVNDYLQQTDPKTRQEAADRLRDELKLLSGLPAQLRSSVTNNELLTEINPWLTKLGQEGSAGLLALDYLQSPKGSAERQSKYRQLQAEVGKLDRNSLIIGSEVMKFVQQALSVK